MSSRKIKTQREKKANRESGVFRLKVRRLDAHAAAELCVGKKEKIEKGVSCYFLFVKNILAKKTKRKKKERKKSWRCGALIPVPLAC